MDLPKFLKQEGDAIVYNGPEGTEMVYYVPEAFFDNTTKTSIAEIVGEYVSFIGVCNWAIIDKNGKIKEMKPLQAPTMILCKPYTIEKEKGVQLGTAKEDDYRLLRFKSGDEVLSQQRVPELIDNVELFFKLIFFNAKIPNTIPYDDIWKLMIENGKLNDFDYNLNWQLLGIATGQLARDIKDEKKLYRLTPMKDKHAYQLISMRFAPKFISPYSALTSENWDEGIRASVLLSQMPEEDIPYSPLEKVVSQ